jgi:uncharacterized protein (DUF2267 family)
MSQTGFAPFTTTVDKTNHILHQIEDAYGWSQDRRNQSYGALRASLHALRDRLTVDEAAQLAAQLPTLVRGIYYEGWDPSRVPIRMDREQFMQRVHQEFRYEVDGGMERLVRTVVNALRPQISDGEWNDVRAVMPKDLATVLP